MPDHVGPFDLALTLGGPPCDTTRPMEPIDWPPTRPRTYADCLREGYGERYSPCPWVGCRHHFALTLGRNGKVIVEPAVPKRNIDNLIEMEETCSLRVAEMEGRTLEEAARVLHLTRERVRQIEMKARAKVTRRLTVLY